MSCIADHLSTRWFYAEDFKLLYPSSETATNTTSRIFASYPNISAANETGRNDVEPKKVIPEPGNSRFTEVLRTYVDDSEACTYHGQPSGPCEAVNLDYDHVLGLRRWNRSKNLEFNVNCWNWKTNSPVQRPFDLPCILAFAVSPTMVQMPGDGLLGLGVPWYVHSTIYVNTLPL